MSGTQADGNDFLNNRNLEDRELVSGHRRSSLSRSPAPHPYPAAEAASSQIPSPHRQRTDLPVMLPESLPQIVPETPMILHVNRG